MEMWIKLFNAEERASVQRFSDIFPGLDDTDEIGDALVFVPKISFDETSHTLTLVCDPLASMRTGIAVPWNARSLALVNKVILDMFTDLLP